MNRPAVIILPICFVSMLLLPIFAMETSAEKASVSLDDQNERLASVNSNKCETLTLLILPLSPVKQEGDLLCWAATAQMAMSIFPPPDGGNIRQCEQANNRFGRMDCCADSTSDQLGAQACDQTGWPELHKYDYHTYTGRIINWTELLVYLCQRHTPVLYAYQYVRNPFLHMKIAYGYQVIPTETSVDQEGAGSRVVFFVDPGDPVGGYEMEVLDFDYWFSDENPDIRRKRDYIDICPDSYVINGSCAMQNLGDVYADK